MPKDSIRYSGPKGRVRRGDQESVPELAHEYHPDKAGGNEQKLKEINEAYEVL